LNDVEDLLSKGIDILALPPREFEASAPAIAAAKAKSVPVFLVDRSAKGEAGVDYVTVMSSKARPDGGGLDPEAHGGQGERG
jgi:galactofuranose transport system substrate-binding protein